MEADAVLEVAGASDFEEVPVAGLVTGEPDPGCLDPVDWP